MPDKETYDSTASLVRRFFASALRITLGVALGLTGVLYPYLYFMQGRMVFIRQPMHPGRLDYVQDHFPEAEDLAIKAPDGVELMGWLLPGTGEGSRPLLIYFGGNAEEVSGTLDEARDYAHDGWSVALVNYRGYGLSGGRPSETALFEDAELIYDSLAARDGVDPSRVALMGRSLGTGVAVHLASVRQVAGIVLVSPYDSLVEVSREHYPYVPVGLLLKHKFESAKKAPSINAPMLAIIGTKDHIVTPERSRVLIEAWGGPTKETVIKGSSHNDLPMRVEYYDAISSFLRTLLQ